MNFLKITEILHKGGIKCSVCGLECEAEIGWGEYYQKEEKEISSLPFVLIKNDSMYCQLSASVQNFSSLENTTRYCKLQEYLLFSLSLLSNFQKQLQLKSSESIFSVFTSETEYPYNLSSEISFSIISNVLSHSQTKELETYNYLANVFNTLPDKYWSKIMLFPSLNAKELSNAENYFYSNARKVVFPYTLDKDDTIICDLEEMVNYCEIIIEWKNKPTKYRISVDSVRKDFKSSDNNFDHIILQPSVKKILIQNNSTLASKILSISFYSKLNSPDTIAPISIIDKCSQFYTNILNVYHNIQFSTIIKDLINIIRVSNSLSPFFHLINISFQNKTNKIGEDHKDLSTVINHFILQSGNTFQLSFDQNKSIGSLSYTNNNLSVSSTSSSKSLSCFNYPLNPSIKTVVIFELVHDKQDDECSCFGACYWPTSDPDYQSSKQLLMVRSYNGAIYNKGRQDSSYRKIHKGDKVQIVYDMPNRTILFSVNGSELKEIFIDIDTSIPLYPAICFYGDDRQILLTSKSTTTKNLPSKEQISPSQYLIGYWHNNKKNGYVALIELNEDQTYKESNNLFYENNEQSKTYPIDFDRCTYWECSKCKYRNIYKTFTCISCSENLINSETTYQDLGLFYLKFIFSSKSVTKKALIGQNSLDVITNILQNWINEDEEYEVIPKLIDYLASLLSIKFMRKIYLKSDQLYSLCMNLVSNTNLSYCPKVNNLLMALSFYPYSSSDSLAHLHSIVTIPEETKNLIPKLDHFLYNDFFIILLDYLSGFDDIDLFFSVLMQQIADITQTQIFTPNSLSLFPKDVKEKCKIEINRTNIKDLPFNLNFMYRFQYSLFCEEQREENISKTLEILRSKYLEALAKEFLKNGPKFQYTFLLYNLLPYLPANINTIELFNLYVDILCELNSKVHKELNLITKLLFKDPEITFPSLLKSKLYGKWNINGNKLETESKNRAANVLAAQFSTEYDTELILNVKESNTLKIGLCTYNGNNSILIHENGDIFYNYELISKLQYSLSIHKLLIIRYYPLSKYIEVVQGEKVNRVNLENTLQLHFCTLSEDKIQVEILSYHKLSLPRPESIHIIKDCGLYNGDMFIINEIPFIFTISPYIDCDVFQFTLLNPLSIDFRLTFQNTTISPVLEYQIDTKRDENFKYISSKQITFLYYKPNHSMYYTRDYTTFFYISDCFTKYPNVTINCHHPDYLYFYLSGHAEGVVLNENLQMSLLLSSYLPSKLSKSILTNSSYLNRVFSLHEPYLHFFMEPIIQLPEISLSKLILFHYESSHYFLVLFILNYSNTISQDLWNTLMSTKYLSEQFDSLSSLFCSDNFSFGNIYDKPKLSSSLPSDSPKPFDRTVKFLSLSECLERLYNRLLQLSLCFKNPLAAFDNLQEMSILLPVANNYYIYMLLEFLTENKIYSSKITEQLLYAHKDMSPVCFKLFLKYCIRVYPHAMDIFNFAFFKSKFNDIGSIYILGHSIETENYLVQEYQKYFKKYEDITKCGLADIYLDALYAIYELLSLAISYNPSLFKEFDFMSNIGTISLNPTSVAQLLSIVGLKSSKYELDYTAYFKSLSISYQGLKRSHPIIRRNSLDPLFTIDINHFKVIFNNSFNKIHPLIDNLLLQYIDKHYDQLGESVLNTIFINSQKTVYNTDVDYPSEYFQHTISLLSSIIKDLVFIKDTSEARNLHVRISDHNNNKIAPVYPDFESKFNDVSKQQNLDEYKSFGKYLYESIYHQTLSEDEKWDSQMNKYDRNTFRIDSSLNFTDFTGIEKKIKVDPPYYLQSISSYVSPFERIKYYFNYTYIPYFHFQSRVSDAFESNNLENIITINTNNNFKFLLMHTKNTNYLCYNHIPLSTSTLIQLIEELNDLLSSENILTCRNIFLRYLLSSKCHLNKYNTSDLLKLISVSFMQSKNIETITNLLPHLLTNIPRISNDIEKEIQNHFTRYETYKDSIVTIKMTNLQVTEKEILIPLNFYQSGDYSLFIGPSHIIAKSTMQIYISRQNESVTNATITNLYDVAPYTQIIIQLPSVLHIMVTEYSQNNYIDFQIVPDSINFSHIYYTQLIPNDSNLSFSSLPETPVLTQSAFNCSNIYNTVTLSHIDPKYYYISL